MKNALSQITSQSSCLIVFLMWRIYITEFTYENFEDKYTDGKLLKDYVVALLVDPTSIEQQHE